MIDILADKLGLLLYEARLSKIIGVFKIKNTKYYQFLDLKYTIQNTSKFFTKYNYYKYIFKNIFIIYKYI